MGFDEEFDGFTDLIAIPMSRHDYGDRCFSYGYDFRSDALLELPLVQGFYFDEYTSKDGKKYLRYCGDDGVKMVHPYSDVAYFIKKYDEHLVGTTDSPYQYIDMGEQFMIVDRGDFVAVLNFMDIASMYAEGIRVERDAYYKAYNEYLVSIGVEPDSYEGGAAYGTDDNSNT